jgi:TRAP-type C4-dicarboxylate transport system substrate-binding protein
MRKSTVRGCLIGAVAAAVLAAAPGPNRASAETELNALVPWPRPFLLSEPMIWFKDLVNAELKGKLKIKYLGASEVVPAFEQFGALQDGVIDTLLTATAYYKGSLPVARAGLFSNMTVPERRKSGFYDLMRKIHAEKTDTIYLAQVGGPPGGFRLYSREKPRAKPDFKGMKFRGGGAYSHLIGALGGTTVLMKPSETHTALERGVVDGLGWARIGVADRALHEVTKFVIDHPFESVDDPILIRGEVWRKLSADTRATLERLAIKVEAVTDEKMAQAFRDEDVTLKKHGMTFFKYAPEDAKRYLQYAHELGWKEIIKADPVNGPKLKETGYRSMM